MGQRRWFGHGELGHGFPQLVPERRSPSLIETIGRSNTVDHVGQHRNGRTPFYLNGNHGLATMPPANRTADLRVSRWASEARSCESGPSGSVGQPPSRLCEIE